MLNPPHIDWFSLFPSTLKSHQFHWLEHHPPETTSSNCQGWRAFRTSLQEGPIYITSTHSYYSVIPLPPPPHHISKAPQSIRNVKHAAPIKQVLTQQHLRSLGSTHNWPSWTSKKKKSNERDWQSGRPSVLHVCVCVNVCGTKGAWAIKTIFNFIFYPPHRQSALWHP